MVAETIAFLIRNLPAVLLVLALILGFTGRPGGSGASRFLAWVLLLPIGITGLWAGIAHVAFPMSLRLISAGRSVRFSSRWEWPTSPSVLRPASPFGAHGSFAQPRCAVPQCSCSGCNRARSPDARRGKLRAR